MRTTRARCPVLALLLFTLATGASAQDVGAAAGAPPPNIILIVTDDVGTDVTSNMYPGLIDDLSARYGPSGLDHPYHQSIRGLPASTPNLDRLHRFTISEPDAGAEPKRETAAIRSGA